MVRVAIYCRVSTSDQSCERQERELRLYASRAGWVVVGVYQETASGARDDRAQRHAVIALAQAREIDLVLVHELTRWGRSTLDLISTMQHLAAWNVSLIAKSGFQLDLSTPQGKLMATLLAAVAEFERDLIRERVKSGLVAAKAKGKKLGRRPGRLQRVARLEAKVKQLRSEGSSIRAIALQLRLSKTTVHKIIGAS